MKLGNRYFGPLDDMELDEVILRAATPTEAGVMSSGDMLKLAGIAAGAEVNQNAFSNVIVGRTTIVADNKTDYLHLEASTNVTITASTIPNKITIAAKDTTYDVATTSANGLMRAKDKSNLNLLKEQLIDNGKVDTLPTIIASETSIVRDRSKIIFDIEQYRQSFSDGYQPENVQRTFESATTTLAGLMSAADKTKLDEIVSLKGDIPPLTEEELDEILADDSPSIMPPVSDFEE